MDDLINKKTEIEENISRLKNIYERFKTDLSCINSEIKDKSMIYNRKLKDFKEMKNTYKAKCNKYIELVELVNKYKNNNWEAVKKEYKGDLCRLIDCVNNLKFEFRVNVFNTFSMLKGINGDKYPNFSRKKEEYYMELKTELKDELFEKIKDKISDKSTFNELIFYINFLIKYEKYFQEIVFPECLYGIIYEKFQYHFMTDRESNRLDKPGWMFEFLLQKYEDFELVFNIYKECRIGENISYDMFIRKTEELINIKIKEFMNIESIQKRKLVLNFVDEFKKFNETLKLTYKMSFETRGITHMLNETQNDFLMKKLKDISEMSYTSWFNEYKQLCKESVVYIMKYYSYDKTFTFESFIKPLAMHIAIFIDNFRFINRDEIKILCYLLEEIVNFKEYLSNEEVEARLEFDNCVPEDYSFKSHIRLAKLILKITNILTELATNDVRKAIRKILHFTYVSDEIKRNFFIELYGIYNDYKNCSYFDKIESKIINEISDILIKEIIIKQKFTSDEYLEFRQFYRQLKNLFNIQAWCSDEPIAALDAIFDGKKIQSKFYIILKKLYNN